MVETEDEYAIDEFEGSIGWESQQGTFSAAKVEFSNPIAYAEDVDYTISFTPKHMVPQNGYIEVDWPKQVSVPDYSFSQSSCFGDDKSAFGTNQIVCEFLDGEALSDPYRLQDPDTPSHFTMQILNAFRRENVQG